MHIPIGNGISLKSTVLLISTALLCVNLSNGILIYSLLKLAKLIHSKDIIQYLGYGIILGGIIYSLLLFKLPGTKILLLAYTLVTASLLNILKNRKNIIMILAVSVVFCLLLLSDTAVRFDKYILNKNFKNMTIKEYKYSPYGQVVLLQKNNEYFLLSNNLLLFSLPDREILHSENFGHIPALHHHDPKNILIIGGSTKYIPMILQYKTENIDYVETDNHIIEIIKNNFGHLDYIFKDKRLNIYNINAEDFIKWEKTKYDLILIGLPDPVNLYLNSCYTKEFFESAKDALTDSGFLALTLPGKKVFLTKVTSELNASVLGALAKNFKSVRTISGRENILIASKKEMPYRFRIKQRLYKIADSPIISSKEYIDDKMDTEKTNWFIYELEKISRQEKLLNTKDNPQTIMFTFLYKQAEFSPYLSVLLDNITKSSHIIAFCAIIILLLLLKFISIYKINSFACTLITFLINFTAVFTLQSCNGQIISKIGFILAVFMSGIIFGMSLVRNTKRSISLNKKIFLADFSFLLVILLWFFKIKFKVDTSPILMYLLLFAASASASTEFLYLMTTPDTYQNKHESKFKISLYGIFGILIASLAGGGFSILVWGMKKSILSAAALQFLILCRLLPLVIRKL
jgi:spermidine synthase